MKIAFQGTHGSYSEAALLETFTDKKMKPIGYSFSEEVFEAVDNGDVDMGFVPVENSIAGNVSVNTDLLFQSDLVIIQEAYFPIHHALLSHPNAKLEDIKVVYSHPVALSQCREFLNLYKLKTIPEYDTAGAARLVKENGKIGEAAIASTLCKNIYHLDIIQENLQTKANNTTRFFAFVKPSLVSKSLKREKTSMTFITSHKPGSLVECLKKFSNHNINLTKIESRPLLDNAWEYVFFADFIGSDRDSNVLDCLKDIKKHTQSVKILGSYPNGRS